MKNLEQIFESNWDEIKGNLKSQWGKLTNQDLKQIDGSYDILKGKLKKYGYTIHEIEDDLEDYFTSEGIQEIKNKAKHYRDETEKAIYSIKDSIEDYIQNYLQYIKDKGLELERNIIYSAKENPLKTLGIAALIVLL